MGLPIGTRLGAYEITGSLGVGGMGEVYRATDTTLGRDVAIKTLPAALASDPDRLARFEREAKLLATLNHPHIGVIHGLDEHEGTRYLAMELVEGETLEAKLEAGALPVDESLRLALQIAEALEAAHAKGVVHRDLKPANIMVTRDGQVKVLDFGLAKAVSNNPEQGTAAHSPALSLAMTQQGLVLGTAGYMSPEQASGQPTDQRADVWGFGVVLYEMLTGLPLFTGESVPHILADVLRAEPDWQRLPKNLHPRLKLLLERCLAKKPHKRLHSIADARLEIEAMLDAPEGPTPASPPSAGRPEAHWPRLVGAVAVAAAIAGVAGWFLRPVPAPAPGPVVRFSIPLPDDQDFSAAPASQIAVSPDGTRIAYTANNQIYLRNLGEREARPVPGTAQGPITASSPAFSPDGQWLAYIHVVGVAGPYVVKRVPISGGAPVPINEATAENFQQGLTWPTPDQILFTSAQGIVRIPANGGAPEVLIPLGEGERFFSPQLLPGGKTVLFTRVAGQLGRPAALEAAQVVVQSIGGSDPTVVWEGGSAARYLPTGHLVYAQGNALFAIPFDPATHAVHGGPVPIVEGLRRSQNSQSDAANFAVSDTGTLAVIPGDANAAPNRITATLTWVDRSGREEPLPARPDDYTVARISPDGTKIALVVGALLVRETPPAIWIYDLRTETLSQLTANSAGDDGPVWSSDSRRIYFRSGRSNTRGVYSIELATGETKLIAAASTDHPFPLPWSIAANDTELGLVDASSLADINISVLSLPDGEFTSLLHETTSSETQPSIAPNGAWLAYLEAAGPADTEGEINIRPFPGVARTRIPVGRGGPPVFSHDGKELFYVAGDSLMAAPVTYEPTLSVGPARKLFESRAYDWVIVGRAWDVDPNGQRFLMIRQPGAPQNSTRRANDRIDVVLNWAEELKQRVPTQ
jgi:eukaryotic-like serine/threonine-protein kinase